LFIKDFAAGGRLTILLTGGRAPCTLELARSFHRAGHRVIVAESVRYHLCRVSRAVERSYSVPSPNSDTESFLEAIESIVIEERVDVLIPTCEEIFYIAKGLTRLGEHCTVWASSIEHLRELHDKWRFILLARRLGLPVPQSRLIETREEWLVYSKDERLHESLVLKPAFSRFASHVLFLEKSDSAAKRRRMLTKAMPDVSPSTPWVAQRTIYGRHICTYSIALEGDLIAHAAYPSLHRVGQGATVYFKSIVHGASLEWVRKFVKAIRFTGQIAFDFIEEEGGGLYALECNPRATSGIHLFGSDGGLVQAFLQPEALRNSGCLLAPGSSGSMLTAAMLGAGLSGIRSNRELRSWLKDFRSARDVVFTRTDMMPGIEQLRVLLDVWRISRTRSITLTHATTIDMEWNGDA